MNCYKKGNLLLIFTKGIMRVGSGERRVESEEWRVESGEWSVFEDLL